jgi:hypothetical protein
MTHELDNDRQHIPAFNVVTPPLSLIINRREAAAPLIEMVKRGKRGFISACLVADHPDRQRDMLATARRNFPGLPSEMIDVKSFVSLAELHRYVRAHTSRAPLRPTGVLVRYEPQEQGATGIFVPWRALREAIRSHDHEA